MTHDVRRMYPLLLLLMVVFVIGCATTRPATIDGVPTDNPIIQEATNRIYNAETKFVLTMEVLIQARIAKKINDEVWDQIADASENITIAIDEAKKAVLEYERQRNAGKKTELDKALTWFEYLVGRLVAHTQEE